MEFVEYVLKVRLQQTIIVKGIFSVHCIHVNEPTETAIRGRKKGSHVYHG
jgi:hypothetical protein